MNNIQKFDYKFKIMILGESRIGKTCFISRYTENKFSGAYLTTVGIDFQTKIITLNNKTIKLQIWDTAGQERFRNITKNYFQTSHGFIVAYDISENESIKYVKNWLNEININAPKNVKVILIGTKCDLDRTISKEEGEKIAIENNIKFFETSAKENINVNETFESLTLEILKYMEEEEKIDGNSKSVVIDRESVKEKEKKEKEKKKCC
jgi:small GTP-binding protein